MTAKPEVWTNVCFQSNVLKAQQNKSVKIRQAHSKWLHDELKEQV